MIRIEHLQKSFKNQKILKDINMQLEEGKVYVLIAPNGTGKTTLLSILQGLPLRTVEQFLLKEK